MPLFNSGKTLQQTLNSISNQSFKDIELVFIDGGSADDTQLIVSDFTKKGDAAVQFISEPDKGIYDAMNKGIALAKGDWLYFMGGDDTFQTAGVLAEVNEAVQQSNTDLLHGNVTGAVSGTVYSHHNRNKILFNGIHHQGIFYKNNVFNYTGNYDLRFKIAADYHLTLKVFLNKVFKTRYADINIALFGEAGLSSQQHDWMFYSYHYRLLAKNDDVKTVNDESTQCLNNSVYACFQLAKTKRSVLFAWQNLLSYTFGNNSLSVNTKARNLLRMFYWTLRPKT